MGLVRSGMEKKADIIPILEGIVEENTKSYQDDLILDVEQLKAAMLNPVPENRVFLWMSRPCGTWCFLEREVFLRDTRAHDTWTHPDYIAQAGQIKAYRITVAPGRPGAFVLGKLQPLDYGEQVERVKRLALPVQQVTLNFEDGETRTMSYTDYTSHFCEFMCHSAPIKTTHYQPENEGELSALLYMERHPPKQRSRRPKRLPTR